MVKCAEKESEKISKIAAALGALACLAAALGPLAWLTKPNPTQRFFLSLEIQCSEVTAQKS